MKKYFILSDIHGFFEEMIKSLKDAGFKKSNKEHVLIVLGDIFDRGPDAIKIFKFISSLPKNRRVLIKGNHEYLFLKLLNKRYPDTYDFSNGTVDTFCQIAGQYYYINEIPCKIKMSDWLETDSYYSYSEELYQEKQSLWEDIRNTVLDNKITSWLKSNEWKDFYELDKYIFVHSFIPLLGNLYTPMWREIKDKKIIEDSTWGCPWRNYIRGLFSEEESKGKVLVCGHWNTSDFFRHLKNDKKYDRYCAPIYFSKGLIGIDGGCLFDYRNNKYQHPQNILVINEEDFSSCYDEEGKKLDEYNKISDTMDEKIN